MDEQMTLESKCRKLVHEWFIHAGTIYCSKMPLHEANLNARGYRDCASELEAILPKKRKGKAKK
jgi:hypothetical protein